MTLKRGSENEITGFKKYSGYIDTIMEEVKKKVKCKEKISYNDINLLHCQLYGINVYYDVNLEYVYISKAPLFDEHGKIQSVAYMERYNNPKNIKMSYCGLKYREEYCFRYVIIRILYKEKFEGKMDYKKLPVSDNSVFSCDTNFCENLDSDMKKILGDAIDAAKSEGIKNKYIEAKELIDDIEKVVDKIEKLKYDSTKPKNPWVVTNPNTIEEKNSMNNKTGENGFKKYSGYIDAIIKKVEREKLFNDDEPGYYDFQHCVIDGINIYYNKENGDVIISEDELSDEHIFADDGKIILQRYYDDIDYNAKICCLTYRYSEFCFTISYVQGKDEPFIKIVNCHEKEPSDIEKSYDIKNSDINYSNMNEVLNEFMNISMDERISIDKKESFSNNAKKLIDAICKIAEKEIETER